MVFVSLQSSETFFKQASLLVEDGLIGMSWHPEPSHMALQRIRWQSRFVAEVVFKLKHMKRRFCEFLLVSFLDYFLFLNAGSISWEGGMLQNTVPSVK